MYSLSWIKRQYRRLGLKKRCISPPDETIVMLIKVGGTSIGVVKIIYKCKEARHGYNSYYNITHILGNFEIFRCNSWVPCCVANPPLEVQNHCEKVCHHYLATKFQIL